MAKNEEKISILLRTHYWCLRKMGFVGRGKWNKIEHETLKSTKGRITNAQIGKLLGRSPAAVRQERYRLNQNVRENPKD